MHCLFQVSTCKAKANGDIFQCKWYINQIVAMDFHEINHNFNYSHKIDLFSRLIAACIIRRKDSELVVDKFMQIWFSATGVGVYTDNGGEFNSQMFLIWLLSKHHNQRRKQDTVPGQMKLRSHIMELRNS